MQSSHRLVMGRALGAAALAGLVMAAPAAVWAGDVSVRGSIRVGGESRAPVDARRHGDGHRRPHVSVHRAKRHVTPHARPHRYTRPNVIRQRYIHPGVKSYRYSQPGHRHGAYHRPYVKSYRYFHHSPGLTLRLGDEHVYLRYRPYRPAYQYRYGHAPHGTPSYHRYHSPQRYQYRYESRYHAGGANDYRYYKPGKRFHPGGASKYRR